MRAEYSLPVWSVAPFALMLLAIAVLPLTVEKWWEKNLNKLWVSLLLGVPVGIWFAVVDAPALRVTALEYFSFIVLLASLFVISGGIVVRGDLRATPFVNTAFLAIGTVLASFMGTTGASMLLIRPLLATNRERKYVVHTIMFFTFLVGNIGGCLTPLGDPPLFMGYLLGVPFSWTFSLFRPWLFACGVILALYFIVDSYLYAKEPLSRLAEDRAHVEPLRFAGLWNFPLLAATVLTVAFLTTAPLREAVLVTLALLSLAITKKEHRRANQFNYAPILEVAVLFFGIFLTMIPAIVLLHTRGGELGISTPSHFFWAAGGLSSFLDNTPTYVTFFALGQGLHQANEIVGMPAAILRGISLGAVFFGASTYIGNAPNFMIKVIAEHRKVKMPSFFGYMVWSILILIPLFFAVDRIFVR